LYQRILVAIDGSSTGDLALREAIRLAQDQHAQLRGIHVLEDIPAMYAGLADGVDLAALDASVRQAGQEALDREVAGAQQAGVQMEAALAALLGLGVLYRQIADLVKIRVVCALSVR